MLIATTPSAQKLAKELHRIANSEEMKELLNMRLMNNGELFEIISQKGLESARNDKTIFRAGLPN